MRLGPAEHDRGSEITYWISFSVRVYPCWADKVETVERYLPNLRMLAALFKGKMRYRAGIRDEVKS